MAFGEVNRPPCASAAQCLTPDLPVDQQVAILVSGLILTVATGLASVYIKRTFEASVVRKRGARRAVSAAAAEGAAGAAGGRDR